MAKWRYSPHPEYSRLTHHELAAVVWTTAAFLYARNHFTIPPAGWFRPFPRSPPHLISVVQKPEIRMEVPSMGFNYRQKRKEFEQNWAKALKQYIAAGMTHEQISSMREFEEELFRQERVYENRVNVGLPDLNILRFSVEEDYFQDLSHHLDAALENLCPGSSHKVTDQDRKVVLLACTGLKQEEIAVILHISQMSVYRHLHKLQKLLKKGV